MSEVADGTAVAFLLDHPGLLDAVVTEPVDDGTGCCAACPGPVRSAPAAPCNVGLLAARAKRPRDARVGEHRQ